MQRTLLVFFSLAIFVSAALPSAARDVSVIRFAQLQKMMSRPSDTTYVFNFFATWCEPCRVEFPALQSWSSQQAGKPVKLIFISLDFKKDRATKLVPFVKKRKVDEDVYLLDETDYNTWINKVDSAWDGNLPMTLVVNNRSGLRRAFPREFTLQELQETFQSFIP